MRFVKLGSVCKLRNGYAFKSANFSEIGVPIIRISNINDNIVTPEKSVRTTFENVFDNYKIIKGDILIAMSGATTGKFGIYNSDEVAYQNQRVGCFKILDNNVINQTYLLQVLNIIKPIIEKTANGGAQPNISANAIEEITIPLPSLQEQIRIAEILTQAENLISQRKENIDLLDELLKSTFLEMFGDPVKNERGIKIAKLGKICDVNSSRRVFVEQLVTEGIPFYRGTEIGKLAEGYKIIPALFITKEHFLKLKEQTDVPKIGDLLMPSICPDGRIYIVSDNNPFYFKDGRVLWIKVNNEIINSKYLMFFLKELFLKKYNSIASGTTFAELKIVALKSINITIPSVVLQNQFAAIVEKVEFLKSENQASLRELENMYGVLSQKAFKGELNIK